MNYKEETYIDSDGQELTKKKFSDSEIRYTNTEDQLHRLDGPARIWPDGTELWFKDGKRHRLDGPARIWSDGEEIWFKDGKSHREDGPAWILSDGTEFYYLEGKEVSRKEIDLIWLKKQVDK